MRKEVDEVQFQLAILRVAILAYVIYRLIRYART